MHNEPLTQEQLDRGCYVKKADKSLTHPACCWDSVVCPKEEPAVTTTEKGRKPMLKALEDAKRVVKSSKTKEKRRYIWMLQKLIDYLKSKDN